MFDAKSILEQLMQGGNPSAQQSRQTPQGGMPDLGDLLRQFTDAATQTQAGQRNGGSMQELPTSNTTSNDAARGNPLEELLRQFAPDNQAPQQRSANQSTSQPSGGNVLEDLLREFTKSRSETTGSPASNNSPFGGGLGMPNAASNSGGQDSGGRDSGGQGAGGVLGDLMGEIFGGGRSSSAPGNDPGQQSGRPSSQASPQDQLREILEKIGGNSPAAGDMMRQLTDFIGNNKVGTGAALGGLGALIFGTRTGRSMAMGAAKVGAMAIVGGLAYKAYQNYSQGRPLVSNPVAPEPAPQGSGFEAEQVTNAAATAYIRGMIAAAAADGRIGADEQQQIIGALSQLGLDAEAEAFLANELNNPASIEDLVNSVSNDTERLQLYTAARVSIDPDTSAEQQFLAVLADRLGIAPELRTHIDAAARGVL